MTECVMCHGPLTARGGSFVCKRQCYRSPSFLLMQEGRARATELGHFTATPVLDSDTKDAQGWITYCVDCRAFLVVDTEESPEPYGLAYTTKCTGKALVPEARRRSLLEYDAATAVVSNEPADRNPPYLEARGRGDGTERVRELEAL